MADQRPSEVLGALPRTRPQRRSTKRPVREEAGSAAAGPAGVKSATPRKRPAAAGAGKTPPTARRAAAKRSAPRSKRNAPAIRQPPQPLGIPSQPRAQAPQHGPEILGTAVQAAAELAEIGLALSARALRRAVARIPRP